MNPIRRIESRAWGTLTLRVLRIQWEELERLMLYHHFGGELDAEN
jgi:hypothetical protein